MCNFWNSVITGAGVSELVKVTSAAVRLSVSSDPAGSPFYPDSSGKLELYIEMTSQQGATCTIGPTENEGVQLTLLSKFLQFCAPKLKNLQLYMPRNGIGVLEATRVGTFVSRLVTEVTALSVVKLSFGKLWKLEDSVTSTYARLKQLLSLPGLTAIELANVNYWYTTFLNDLAPPTALEEMHLDAWSVPDDGHRMLLSQLPPTLKRLRLGVLEGIGLIDLSHMRLTHLLVEQRIAPAGGSLLKELAEALPTIEALVIGRVNYHPREPQDQFTYADLVNKCCRLVYLDVKEFMHFGCPPRNPPKPAVVEWPRDREPIKIVKRPYLEPLNLHPSVWITGDNVELLVQDEEIDAAKKAFLRPWICKFNYE